MRTRVVALALGGGLVTFIVVVAVLTYLLVPATDFSALIAIPAGLIAAAGVATSILLERGHPADQTSYRLALAFGAFGIVMLFVVAIGVGIVSWPLTTVLSLAVVLGLIAGLAMFALP